MNNNNQEYYEGLGIPRDADQRAIQDPYRRLAMKWHPYRNKSAEAGERFKRMATAYAIRSDPKKRPWCDARGFESVAHDTYDDLFGDLDLGSRCTLKARRNSNTQAKVLCSWPPSPREQMEVAVDANSGSSQCRQLCRFGFLARTTYSACKGSSALVRGMNTKAS
jgi:curved DNA-binding protein CbpA